MKPRLVLTVALLFASIALLPVTLRSQGAKRFLFRMNVPFDFVAGDTHLPAGDYSVFRVSGPDVLLIESDNNRGSAMVLVDVSPAGLGEHPSKLVFHRYLDQYFLAEVRAASDGLVRTAVKSRQEVLAAKKALQEERTLAAK